MAAKNGLSHTGIHICDWYLYYMVLSLGQGCPEEGVRSGVYAKWHRRIRRKNWVEFCEEAARHKTDSGLLSPTLPMDTGGDARLACWGRVMTCGWRRIHQSRPGPISDDTDSAWLGCMGLREGECEQGSRGLSVNETGMKNATFEVGTKGKALLGFSRLGN